MREISPPDDAGSLQTTDIDEPLDEAGELLSDDPEYPSEEPQMPVQEEVPEKLMSRDEALERIPVSLRKEMQESLRAEFREVRFWKKGNRH